MLTRRPEPRPEPPGRLPTPVGAALGLPLGVVAVLVTQLLGGLPGLGLALAVLTAAALGALTTAPGATAAATLVWACHDGFTINGLGQLGATPAELIALGAVAGAALAVRAVRVASRTAAHGGPGRLPAGYPAITAAPGVRPV